MPALIDERRRWDSDQNEIAAVIILVTRHRDRHWLVSSEIDRVEDAACLVLDINLGGMSGFELRRRLASARAKLPVIFITAVDDEATHKEAMEAGCVACLHKPFPADQLLGAIAKATG